MKKIVLFLILMIPLLGGCGSSYPSSTFEEALTPGDAAVVVNGMKLVPVSESGLLDRDGNPLREEGLYICQGSKGLVMDIGESYLHVFFTQAFCNTKGESMGGSGDTRNIQPSDWQKVYIGQETIFEFVYLSFEDETRRSLASIQHLFLGDSVNIIGQWNRVNIQAEKIEIFVPE